MVGEMKSHSCTLTNRIDGKPKELACTLDQAEEQWELPYWWRFRAVKALTWLEHLSARLLQTTGTGTRCWFKIIADLWPGGAQNPKENVALMECCAPSSVSDGLFSAGALCLEWLSFLLQPPPVTGFCWSLHYQLTRSFLEARLMCCTANFFTRL